MLFTDIEKRPEHGPKLSNRPLAARMRPRTFDEYVGQQHVLGAGKLLRRAIEADRFTAIIVYGPPGVGKTSLAELIATVTESHFERLSAVTSAVADIRRAVEEALARQRLHDGRRTILFVDEIHRFNKAQQDVLLPHVENGTVRLVGATTENPFFHVVGPLLSRAQVFQLKPLTDDDIHDLIQRCVDDDRAFPKQSITVSEDALKFWASACEGDARRALTAVEIAVLTTAADDDGKVCLDLAIAEESIQQKALVYGDDGHYDTASAFIKSMRGGDPDAAVYWLAKMLEAGEDIRFIARRVVILASEDIGNADPRALTLAVSAMQAVQMIGMPEARIILSQAVTYCATAPKSNAAYMAINKAIADVKENRVQPVPVHLRDGHYQGAKRLGHGAGYAYSHNFSDGISGQEYLEVPVQYYEPRDSGYEARIGERLNYWRQQKENRQHAERDPEDKK